MILYSDNNPTPIPHDLRRTYGQLGYEAEIPITQISNLLGLCHSSVTTHAELLIRLPQIGQEGWVLHRSHGGTVVQIQSVIR